MSLTSDLVSQFVKATKDTDTSSEEPILYGTISINGDTTCVILDGSDELTPVMSTAAVKDGERVLVTIKNHTAIVTGNLDDPSASSLMVGDIGIKVEDINVKLKGFVTFEGLEDGTTVIDGGCIETGILRSKDGKTFRLDLDRGKLSLIGSGKFQNAAGDTYITLEGNELVFYSLSEETDEFLDAIHFGFIRGTSPDDDDIDVDYPYMLLGNAGGGTDVGLVKKFWNGLWVGNSTPKNLSGEFTGMRGASGIFIDTIEDKTYVVEGTEMKNIYTGAAIAKFK